MGNGTDLVTSGGHQIVRVTKGVIKVGAFVAVAGAAIGAGAAATTQVIKR